MSYEEIQAALAKQINYEELARLLELDLNSIADEIITDPTEYIQFQVFFDSGEFDTTIEAQAVGEGQGIHVTPILVTFINGDYSTSRGPQFFSTVFGIEVLAFEKDRENVRKIFETYSYLNQGKIDNEDLGIYTTTTLEFPVFGAPFEYKGFTRTQGFMRLFMSYMYSGQMTNDVQITINGNDFKPQTFNITKKRIHNSAQQGGQSEVFNIYNSEITTITGSILYDGSPAATSIFEGITELNVNINKEYEIEVTYPNITTSDYSWSSTNDTNFTISGASTIGPEDAFGVASNYDVGTIARLSSGHLPISYTYWKVYEELIPRSLTYLVRLDNGDMSLTEGGIMQLSFSFVLSNPGTTVSPQVT